MSAPAWVRGLRARGSLGVLALLVAAALFAGVLPQGGTVAALAMGARMILVHGAVAGMLAVVVGGLLGATAGHAGGAWDGVVTRLVEIAALFPGVVFVALLCAVHRPSPLVWIAALAVVRLPECARLARADVIRLNACEFMQSARALGASPSRMLWRHAGPHLGASLAQSFVFSMGTVVLVDTALVALGLGPSQGSWGTAVASAVVSGRPWAAAAPVCLMVVTMLALSGLAEMVRERLDPAVRRTTPLRAAPPGSR